MIGRRRAVLRLALLAPAALAQNVSGAAGSGAAPARVALAIGNGAYDDAPLRNPVNDARAVSAALKTLGFDVTTRENLEGRDLREALRRFVLDTRGADVRLLYFAGHGLQLRGRNYLLPIGARLDNETHVLERTADVTEVIEQLGAIERGASVVIIDACRVHPMFDAGTRRMWAARAGLSRVKPPVGTVVAFSTRPGQVARDGGGATSVYTRHLTQTMRDAPGLPVEAFFKRVRAGVVAETKNRQIPWESSDLTGELCLRPDGSGRCAGETAR